MARGNIKAGLRFDHYGFVAHDRQSARPRRLTVYFFAKSSCCTPPTNRVFQTPAMENLLLASSPQLDSVNPVVSAFPVPVARANYYEGGITKSFLGKIPPGRHVFRRDFHNY